MSAGAWILLLLIILSILNWRSNVKSRKEAAARRRKARRSADYIYDPYRRNQRRTRGFTRTTYTQRGADRDALVYLVHDRERRIAKIGFGSEGRILMYFQSTQSRTVGEVKQPVWELIGAGQFSNRDAALKAESKVLYLWRSVLSLGPAASREQMGISRIKVNNRSQKTNLGGHTETVDSKDLCLACSWALVENADGFVSNIELANILKLAIGHSDCDESPVVDGESFETYHQLRPGYLRQTPNKPAKISPPKIKPSPTEAARSEEDKFWTNVKGKVDDSACWVWLGTSLNEYGAFHYQGSLTTAHRVSWMLANQGQEPPNNLWNVCGNKKCVNPTHWHETPQNYLECDSPGCTNLTKNKMRAGICEKCKSRRRRERAREKESGGTNT